MLLKGHVRTIMYSIIWVFIIIQKKSRGIHFRLFLRRRHTYSYNWKFRFMQPRRASRRVKESYLKSLMGIFSIYTIISKYTQSRSAWDFWLRLEGSCMFVVTDYRGIRILHKDVVALLSYSHNSDWVGSLDLIDNLDSLFAFWLNCKLH